MNTHYAVTLKKITERTICIIFNHVYLLKIAYTLLPPTL